MDRILRLVTGRVAPWVIVAVWLAAIFAIFGFGLPDKFRDAENNESSSYLPEDAEATKALKVTESIQGAELAPLVIVYQRENGLTAADQRRIKTDVERFNKDRSDPESPLQGLEPFRPLAQSEDGKAALVGSAIEGDGQGDTILDPVNDLRDRLGGEEGLTVKVTGGAGFAADAIEVFEQINGTLVGAAFLLVIVLLIIIYRSPFLLFLPLIAVAFAEITTQGIGYGLTEAGVTVNGQSSSILSILVLGAGTDYALLLIARYREELRGHEDRRDAMRLALRSAGPAIIASAGTVIAALLTLALADVNSTASLGPIGAIGIAVALVSMLTLLPALLILAPRGVFWPRVPHVGDAGVDATHGAWRNLGERIAVRPRRVWLGAIAILAVLALGNLDIDTGLTQANSFRGEVEAVEGQELVAESFPAGSSIPTEVIVRDASKVQAVGRAVEGVDGVAAVRPGDRGKGAAVLQAQLELDPYSTEAYDLIPEIREVARKAGGPDTLVGGASAVERDLRTATTRDTKLIVPLALAIVFLILVLLLRAVLLPLALLATVVVSFLAALGVGIVVFDVIFGFAGIDPSLPLFAFIFLVALGIDYNIFLMARVREETLEHGTREGMLRGLAVTGGVITSAGVVLAGVFAVLGVLPLVFLTEIGFVVAFGVLLDTFLVRSILVPALTLDVGRAMWWPSTLARHG
ncbi:MAG: MMPL family transporter [Solirubrobacterales bacterium]